MPTMQLIACSVQQDTCRKVPVQRIVFRVRQESINILKEKKHVRSVKLDVRPTLQATIKTNVCCVLLVKRLQELAVQNVKIVVLEDMVMVASSAKLDNIAHPRQTMPRRVRYAILGGINLTLDKQAAFRAHLENTNISKEQKHVWTVKLDDRRTLLKTIRQSAMPVWSVFTNHVLAKLVASPVYLAHIKMSLVNRYVKNATQDCIVVQKILPVESVQVVGCQQKPKR